MTEEHEDVQPQNEIEDEIKEGDVSKAAEEITTSSADDKIEQLKSEIQELRGEIAKRDMTLADQFAAHATAGLIQQNVKVQDIGRVAYQVAGVMIHERERLRALREQQLQGTHEQADESEEGESE